MTITVPFRLHDTRQTSLRNTHKAMSVFGRSNRIDGDAHATIGPVLESDWEGDTRSEFSVELRLSCTGPNGSPGDEVGDKLWAVSYQRSIPGQKYHAITHEMVSNSSEPTGIPISVISIISSRAMRKPLLILNELSRSGSLRARAS